MFFLIIIALCIVFYVMYSGVIKAANAVREALSGIDVQLKNRADLIPNILQIAQKYMDYETALFSDITKLRAQAQNASIGTDEKFDIENALESKMKQLMINVENYPDLKADSAMITAMQTYNEVEGHIAASRRFYNSALTILKNKIMIFPGSLFKSFAGDTSFMSYFQTDEDSKKSINASDYLK